MGKPATQEEIDVVCARLIAAERVVEAAQAVLDARADYLRALLRGKRGGDNDVREERIQSTVKLLEQRLAACALVPGGPA